MARQLGLCTDQESDPAWDPDTDTDPFPFIFHGPEIAVRLFGFSHQLFSFPFGVGSVTKGPSEQTNCHGAVPEMSH